MKLTLPSVFLLLASVVSAASVHTARQQGGCPEAGRFGEVSITPDSVVPGGVRCIFSLPTVRFLKC